MVVEVIRTCYRCGKQFKLSCIKFNINLNCCNEHDNTYNGPIYDDRFYLTEFYDKISQNKDKDGIIQ